MTGPSIVRILCVDDHPIVLEGLSSVLSLQPDFSVVGVAASATQAIELTKKLHPDVLLLDLRLRDGTGFQVMDEILRLRAGTYILVLTSLEGDADVERALAHGALGYLVKGASRDELARAIRTVSKGRRYLASAAALIVAEHSSSERLTPREQAVLELMAQGLRNKEIGAELAIAEDTVKMHVKNILAKLGARDRTEAVIIAIQRGLHHL